MEDNAFKKLQIIRDNVFCMIYNFDGINTYHQLIFNTLQEMIIEKVNLHYDGFTNPILDVNDEQKILIMNAITDIIDYFGSIENIFVENVLSLICKKLDNKDYKYDPQEFFSLLSQTNNNNNQVFNHTNNTTFIPVASNPNVLVPILNNQGNNSFFDFQNSNFEKISNSLINSNNKSIANFSKLYNQNQELSLVKEHLYTNIVYDKNRITNMHNLTMLQLQLKGFDIWKDRNNKLWYICKPFEEKQKTTISELRDICKGILGYHIGIYNNSDEVLVIDANYLIVSLLKIVRKEIFNPFSNNEFVPIGNNLYDRNTFEYTKHLKKRFEPRIYLTDKTFIENLLNVMFSIQEQSQFIMTWYSKYMIEGTKSNIAVVLIGDSETTDILVNSIFKPIFAKKKHYICVIDDNVLAKESNDENLLNNKVLYHIDNLGAKSDKRRVKKLVRNIVKPNFITLNEAWDTDELYIHGNLLITSDKDTPYPYLEDIFSQCVVLRVNDIKTIQKKLNIDENQLDQMIEDDLDKFSTRLLQHDINHLTVINTDEKLYLESMKNGVLITPEIDCRIDKYISNIRNKRIESFNTIKVYDEKMYDEFLANINEDMTAQPLQSTYFNIINGKELIPHNGEFLELLKNKADMFKETPDDKSKVNGKKRYKIF